MNCRSRKFPSLLCIKDSLYPRTRWLTFATLQKADTPKLPNCPLALRNILTASAEVSATSNETPSNTF